MKTKLISLCLALFAATTLFASDTHVDGIWYDFDVTNLTASVTYRGNWFSQYENEYTGSVVIPASVPYDGKTYSVTTIENNAFHGCTGLTSVTIPNSVTTIGACAFEDCSGLTSITIGNSVTTIGWAAFFGCSGLKKTNYTGTIADWCKIFFNVDDGGDPTTNSNPMRYSHNFYINDVEVKDLVIPEGVTTIEWCTFYNCKGLSSVTIPNSVTTIGDCAFYGCSGLKKTNYTGTIADWCKIKFSSDDANPMCRSHNFYINDVEVKDLVIPEGVDMIGDYAFRGCDGLTSITIPNSVTTIGWAAFSNCSSLTSVTIGNSVTAIRNYAFEGCTNLKTIYNNSNLNITKGSTDYGYVAYYADNVYNGIPKGDYVIKDDTIVVGYIGTKTDITIPDGTTTIGEYAFGCSGLTSITIPNSVTTIGEWAFVDCSGLKKTNYTGTIANWCKIEFGNEDANPVSYSHNFYINDVEIKDLIIPQGVDTIGDYAFDNCTSLTSITIPNSVTTIEYDAFYNCSGLKKTNYIGTIANWCKIEFGNNDANPVSYSHNFYINDVEIKDLVILEGVDTIGDYAFDNCTSLTSVTIPNSVTTIGQSAFSGCSGLTSVTIGNSVTTIGNKAFYQCTNLKTIINGSSLSVKKGSTNYGYVAYYADKVYNGIPKGDYVIKDDTIVVGYIGTKTDITIPDGITTIGEFAFSGCSGLTSVTIPNSVTTIGDYAFDNCSSLTSVTIPNSVTKIGSSAFSGCSGIKSVTWNAKNCNGYNFGSQVETFVFGDSVEVIPANVCQDMAQLTTITIPSSVQSIGNSAFKNCTGISELNINDGITHIGDSAFYGLSNKNLKEIALPNSVETIGKYAFAECSYLKTITLGAKLEDIDEYAFQNDERLIYVNCYAEEPPVLQENAFDNYDIYLQVPCEVVDEYKVAKGWKLFNKENVSCLSAEGKTVTGDDVIVTPSATEATFVWPSNDQADSYSLEITKDGVVFCTLKFNANGQLTSIAFAPSRWEAHTMPAATMTTNGWQFTVTGLNQASKYAYTMDVTDASQKSIKTYTGEFATDGYTDLEGLTIDNAQCTVKKMIIDNQLFIRRNNELYNAMGQKVR